MCPQGDVSIDCCRIRSRGTGLGFQDGTPEIPQPEGFVVDFGIDMMWNNDLHTLI